MLSAVGAVEMSKLGQWQNATGDVVAGGSKHLHAAPRGGSGLTV